MALAPATHCRCTSRPPLPVAPLSPLEQTRADPATLCVRRDHDQRARPADRRVGDDPALGILHHSRAPLQVEVAAPPFVAELLERLLYLAQVGDVARLEHGQHGRCIGRDRRAIPHGLTCLPTR